MAKTAIILLNLGGPDGPDAVRPFLFNLFNDPAIIGAPGVIRTLLAWMIARRRAPFAREIYAKLGGGSPIVPNTLAQARALEAALTDLGEVRCLLAMRYWTPRAYEAVQAAKDWGADQIVVLPLYPQYSTTTTGSSLRELRAEARRIGLSAPIREICCYPEAPGFIAAAAGLVRAAYDEAAAAGHGRPRLLLSAHGLPKRVVAKGDPYQVQVERASAALVAALGVPDLDWTTCYQSRVGPLEWIGPATDDEIRRAGADKIPVVLFPVAFVSEHSETLVELDVEYAELAHAAGVPLYRRVPTVSADPAFIAALAQLVRTALARAPGLAAPDGTRICPAACGRCALAELA